MDRHPSDRILEEWDALASGAQRPAEAPRRRIVRGTFNAGSLVPLAAAALIVAVGIAWLGGRESRPNVGASPSPSAVATAPVVAASATPEPASATPEPCTMTAVITSWEGAAGSRIAALRATNTGDTVCSTAMFSPAQLVDGTGRVLAQTGSELGNRGLDIQPGDTVRTMASVSNVCGDPPVAPVTIRFEFANVGTVTADPLSATDATVPPCNGPGLPSSMSIQGWTR